MPDHGFIKGDIDPAELLKLRFRTPEIVPVDSKTDYARNQYRIMRHEGTELLHRAIVSYRRNRALVDSSERLIYAKV